VAARAPDTALPVDAVYVAAFAAFAIAFSGILVRLADVTPATAATLRCVYAIPVLAVLAAVEARRRPADDDRPRWPALAAGALFGGELVIWHQTIEEVGAGLATVLANLQVVFVALLAWLALGERPSRRFAASVPVTLVGIAGISGVLETGAYGDNAGRGVAFGLATAAAYAGVLLLFRQSGRGGPIMRPLLDLTVAAAVVAAGVGLALGDLDPVPSAAAQGWLVLLAVSTQVLGMALIGLALPRLPAAVGAALLLLQPVASVLLAIVVLDESPSTLQLGGVALVLAGVLVVATRRAAPVP
jgi:drug/metabolite transporter (DMT)-like permease